MHKEEDSKGKDIYTDASLLNDVLTGACADEQAKQLFEERPWLREAYRQTFTQSEAEDTFGRYGKYSSEKAFKRFEKRVGRKLSRRTKIVALWRSVAAVAIVAVGIVTYYIYGTSSSTDKEMLIAPGEEKALLSFSEGASVNVNAQNSVDTVIDHVKISCQNGVLSYRPQHDYVYVPSVSTSYTLKLNKLTIPLGAEHKVVLSDGTSVCLNAGSKLVYPISFQADERIVYLEGEGYFDVAKDADHPFIVNTKFGSIRVLGTSFNVNAYPEADGCRTTLVQGSVQCTTASGEVKELEPNEQLVMDGNGGSEKYKVNVDEYVGWTRGLYIFKDRTLKEIMDTFERWYNVKVTYANPEIATWKYSGTVKRDESINAFLHALELTDEIYFKIRERDIEIYEN